MLLRSAVGLVTAAVVLSGCASGTGSADDASAEGNGRTPVEQLLERPTAEQAEATYRQQLVRVRAALEELAPTVAWDGGPPQRTRDNACREPFSDVDGSGVFGYATGGGGAIPDEDWDRAITITGDVLETEGYDRVQVTFNKPGLHDVSFYGRYGSILTISGERSTGIDLLDSGCFLTAEAHAAAQQKGGGAPGG